MGTPGLAARALAGLYEAGYELPLILTQPDRPKGRGNKEALSAVKAYATGKGLTVYQPSRLSEPETIQRIRQAAPDAIVVAAYGKILPAALLEAAPLGCLNIHASLLPAYRGAAPIQWALLNGEKETGVTIMKIDEGVDTGPILLQKRLPVPEDMDHGGLYELLSDAGASLLLEALPLWAGGRLTPREQPAEGLSYAARLERAHEAIDWTQPAEAIRNRIRAFSPSPGASAHIGDKEIKILRAKALPDEEAAIMLAKSSVETWRSSAPDRPAPGLIIGAVRQAGPVVAAGEGSLLLTLVQPAGRKPMDGWAWLNGSRLAAGETFGAN